MYISIAEVATPMPAANSDIGVEKVSRSIGGSLGSNICLKESSDE
jgi:hypothetical protein